MEYDEYIDSIITNNRMTIILADEDGEILGAAVPAADPETNKQLVFNFGDDNGNGYTIEDELSGVYMPEDTDIFTTPKWIWHDPAIFDNDAKKLFVSLPPGERDRLTSDLLERFYQKRPEYSQFARDTIYNKPLELLQFFKSISLDDFRSCKIANAEIRFDSLQNMIQSAEKAISETPIDPGKLSTIWPILSIRELFLESELAALYYLKNPKKSARQLAAEKGAIMTIGGRLADVSNKDYSGWLDERPNKYAYVSYTGDKHYFDKIDADPEGRLHDRLVRSIEEQDKRARKAIREGRFFDGRPPEHEHINAAVLQALLKVALDNPRSMEGRYFFVHVPTLAKELNEHYKTSLEEYDEAGELKEGAAEIRQEERGKETYQHPNFMDLITDLNYWVGVIDNMPTRIVSINQVDYKSNTIRIDAPYIYDVIRANDEKRKLEAEKKGKMLIKPGYNYLLHTGIATEKDKIAVDLATTIINRILQRGTRNYEPAEEAEEPAPTAAELQAETEEPKRITLKIKYSDLIEETPALKMAYNGAKQKYKYDILNRKFKTAFRILKNKTDIYEYYINLDIPNIPPTPRTLDSFLIITHQGINKNYSVFR